MDQRINDQSFLGRVFDSYQNMRQIAMCLDEAAQQRRVEHPRFLELSRRPTGIHDYLPNAEWIRYPTHQNDESTLGDPVALPFADKSVDGCLISDVYEHIPAHSRRGLLKEMLRVTDGLVLIACPNGNEVVSKLDKLVFDFIWGKYGERFTPLEQHVQFGVEPLDQVVARLKTEGADQVAVMPANYVYRWIHMILIYFDLQHRNPGGHLFEPLNRIYNERLSPFDYREPCYRYLIAVSTNAEISVDALGQRIARPPAGLLSIAESDEMLAQTFREIDSTAADEVRRLHASMDQMQRELEAKLDPALADENRRLHASLEQMKEELAAKADAEDQVRRLQVSLENMQEQLEVKKRSLIEVQSLLDYVSGSMGGRFFSEYGKIKYRYLQGVYRRFGLSKFIRNGKNQD